MSLKIYKVNRSGEKASSSSKIDGEIDNITYEGHRKVDLGY